MEKNPKAPQNNPSTGTRPYAQDKGGYIQKMRRVTDSGLQYMMREFNAFMKHSEMKKPYMAPTYDDMEYGTTPWEMPDRPPVNPVPQPPNPEPMTPGPTPGPSPLFPWEPPPWWNNVYFCQVPPFEFCAGGPPVVVPITTNDRVVGVETVFDDEGSSSVGGGAAVVVNPGTSSYVNIYVTTSKGATCSGMGHAKDPDTCLSCGTPSIGYTTTGMNINETQQLSVVNGSTGPYTWALLSGGGSISSSGLYTAPSSNANCSSNPTIGLYCNGQLMASLSLAINGYVDLSVSAGFTCTDITVGGSSGGCYYCFNCSGGLSINVPPCSISGPLCSTSSINCPGYPGICTTFQWGLCTSSLSDGRTALMKANGCCPPQLM